jgi:hypothetical protein
MLEAIVALAALTGIVLFMLRGGWFSKTRGGGGFSLARAGRGRSPYGYLATAVLAIVAATQLVVQLATETGSASVTAVLTGVLVFAAVGLVVAERLTLFLLAVAGIAGATWQLAVTAGPGGAALTVLAALMVVWLYGALRGSRPSS